MLGILNIPVAAGRLWRHSDLILACTSDSSPMSAARTPRVLLRPPTKNAGLLPQPYAPSPTPHETLYKSRYLEFNQRILATIPADQLLVMNITAGDGWSVLCPFLPKPIPPAPSRTSTRVRNAVPPKGPKAFSRWKGQRMPNPRNKFPEPLLRAPRHPLSLVWLEHLAEGFLPLRGRHQPTE